MKKVMLAIGSLGGGGAERVVSVWANKLCDKGYDVTVLAYGHVENEYKFCEKVSVCTVVEYHEDIKHLNYITRLKKMRAILKMKAPDVLISFLPQVQIWMMLASWGMRLRRVETVRNNPWMVAPKNTIVRILWKMCFKRADSIIIQTREQAEFFGKKEREKSVLIPNPISEQFRANVKETYSDKVRRFIAVGRIATQKNYPLMLEAFSLAMEKDPEIELSIYGAGEDGYVENIERQIKERGLENNVRLMGRTQEMHVALLQADAFIMTSDYEGMPNALVEAMAIGLPCISTNCKTGPKDLIDTGKNGFLVKEGDPAEVAAAIIKVATLDREQAFEVGQEARQRVLDLCSEKNSLERLLEII